MNTIDLKDQVRRAISSEWPAFASAHPNLAAVLDETVLLEPAMKSLADDPEYVEAMRTADGIGAGADAVVGLISRLVRQWLRTLV